MIVSAKCYHYRQNVVGICCAYKGKKKENKHTYHLS